MQKRSLHCCLMLLVLALLATGVVIHASHQSPGASGLDETLLLATHRASPETQDAVKDVRRDPTNRPLRHVLAKRLLDDGLTSGDPFWFQLVLDLLAGTADRDGARLAGQALRNLHRFEAARAAAVALTNSPAAQSGDYLLLGDVELERGDFDAAQDAYQRAIELAPGALAYGRAAQLNFRLGRLGAAISLNQLAVRSTAAGDRAVRSWLLTDAAQFALAVEDADSALALARSAVRAQPTPAARFWHAAALSAANQSSTALNALRELSEDQPSPDVLRWAVALASRIGCRTSAEAMQRLLVESGLRLDARGYAQWLIERGGDLSLAESLIRDELAARRDPKTLALASRLALLAGEPDQARALIREILQKAGRSPFPEVQRAIAAVMAAEDPGLASYHRDLAHQHRFLMPPMYRHSSDFGAFTDAAVFPSRADPADSI